ncbi:hypothetical protein LEMLEM_LOCUS15297 [Lemmus lemmus]
MRETKSHYITQWLIVELVPGPRRLPRASHWALYHAERHPFCIPLQPALRAEVLLCPGCCGQRPPSAFPDFPSLLSSLLACFCQSMFVSEFLSFCEVSAQDHRNQRRLADSRS